MNSMNRLGVGTVFLLAANGWMLASASETSEHETHHEHAVHAGFFFGGTSNLHSEHTDITIGFDVEGILPFSHGKVGIGFLSDFVFAEHRETLVAAAIVGHPTPNWRVYLAPGAVFEDGSDHREWVVRVGTSFVAARKGSVSISPTVNLDVIGGNASVAFGVTIGFGFGR